MSIIYKLMIFLFVFSRLAMAGQSGYTSKEMIFLDEYSADIKERYNIERRLFGFESTGPDKVYHGKIHRIVLGYSVDKNLRYDEAKELFYKIVDELIEKTNNRHDLADLFYNYPIDYSNLQFALSFDYKSKDHLNLGEIDSIHIFEDEAFIFEVESRTKSDIKTTAVTPNISVLTEWNTKTKCTREPLPQKKNIARAPVQGSKS